MELRQVEYVVGIVDHGGFTRAAGALHVTQSALSDGIARLETELGVELFHRVGRRAVLSAAGAAFLEPARQLLRDRAVLTTSVAAVAGLEAGRLDLVALPTLAVEPLASVVGRFRARHPGVAVYVEQPEDAAAVPTMVHNGTAEVGLTELPIAHPGLVSEPLLVQTLVVAIARSSPLARRRRLTIADLAGVPLILPPPGTSMRRLVDAAFAAEQLTPTIAVQTEQREGILPLVVAGAGATIVPRSVAEAASTTGAVVAALVPGIRREIGLIRRRGPISPAAEAFLELARTHATG
jgi:LysR family carnitine catabolism transcriptional activator